MEMFYENEIDFGDTNLKILSPASVREFPYRSVGVIYAWLEEELFIGTGFLLASNLVLTVAHNLYSRELKCYLNNLVFYPGVSGQHDRKNGLRVIDWRLPQEYISTEGIDPIKYDYALLKLEGHVEGAEFLEIGGSYLDVKEEIGIIGYRSLSCSLDTAIQSCLWKPNAFSVQSNGEVLRHKLSTLGGNSGSPILVKRGEKHTVIAIHKGAPPKADYNEARIITDDVVVNVIAWEKEMMNSRIKFCLMFKSHQKNFQTDTAQWLREKNIKLAVIATKLQQPKPIQLKEKKDKQLENRKKFNQLEEKKEKNFEIKNPFLIEEEQGNQHKIKRGLFSEIVKQLKGIPKDDKKKITSLTLKLTSIDDAIQTYFIDYSSAY